LCCEMGQPRPPLEVVHVPALVACHHVPWCEAGRQPWATAYSAQLPACSSALCKPPYVVITHHDPHTTRATTATATTATTTAATATTTATICCTSRRCAGALQHLSKMGMPDACSTAGCLGARRQTPAKPCAGAACGMSCSMHTCMVDVRLAHSSHHRNSRLVVQAPCQAPSLNTASAEALAVAAAGNWLPPATAPPLQAADKLAARLRQPSSPNKLRKSRAQVEKIQSNVCDWAQQPSGCDMHAVSVQPRTCGTRGAWNSCW